MYYLKDIIEHCHQRRETPFRQRKTVVTPALYNKDYPYQLTVYCAQRCPVLLADLEQANISFMPIGQAPDNDRGPKDFGGERFLRRQGIKDWNMKRLRRSWGIQVYTGIPSESHDARWHDIHFTYSAISAAPDAIFTCVDTLVNAVDNPLLVLSKSGGLRFSCRVPDYLHSRTEDARRYIYKHAPTPEDPNQRDVYLEIVGEEGYSRWDARYEILLGNLLDPPVIAKEVLFAPINALRAELHAPASLEGQEGKDARQAVSVAPPSLGSRNLDLAKKAFVKRGFSYLRQEDGLHYWIPPNSSVDDSHVVLWESDGFVWIRASTPDVGLPMEATPITKVWEHTGIVWLASTTGVRISDKLLAVRAGKLSPLAIKRSPVVLQKPEYTKENYGTPEKDAVQMQRISDGTARILALITPEINTRDYETVSYFLNSRAIRLNMASTLPTALQHAKAQRFALPQLFCDPQYAELLEELFKEAHETERLCIISGAQAHRLFPECRLSRKLLEEWHVDQQGGALGDFASALLHAVEVKNRPYANTIKRIRAVMQVFEWREEEIIKQMRHVTGCQNSDWTFWHQLQRFFAHYTRDADAPMRWHDGALRFWVPPVLSSSVKRLVLLSTILQEQHLRKAFPEAAIQVRHTEPMAWIEGNRVFQIRTGNYPLQTIIGHKGNWNVRGVSKIGQRFLAGIRAEIERDPSIKHAIITYKWVAERLDDLEEKENVRFVTDFGNVGFWNHAFEETQVVWIIGTPQWLSSITWKQAQILFGDDEAPLSYEEEILTGATYRYKDERLQGVYEQVMAGRLIRIILRTGLDRWTDKQVVLISSLALPNITDRPETLLFDWEDFEVAGGLDKLPEAIAIRERFEAERDNLTAASGREEIERVLGCSSRQANRFLRKLRGGKPLRVPFREQILTALASDGEKSASELVEVIDGHPKAVRNELSRLVEIGEIVRVRWGVYTLPSE